jgi:hypothetical protein
VACQANSAAYTAAEKTEFTEKRFIRTMKPNASRRVNLHHRERVIKAGGNTAIVFFLLKTAFRTRSCPSAKMHASFLYLCGSRGSASARPGWCRKQENSKRSPLKEYPIIGKVKE